MAEPGQSRSVMPRSDRGVVNATHDPVIADLGNIHYYLPDNQDLVHHCHLRSIEMSLEALEKMTARQERAEQRLGTPLLRHVEFVIASDCGGALLADMDDLKPPQRRRYVALRDRFGPGL